MGLESATYNITFEWISGAHNKAADCLSHIVKLPWDKPVSTNVLSVTDTGGPAFNTRSQTCECLSTDTSTSQPDVIPDVSEAKVPTPKSMTADRLQALLQMQKIDPFCKRISKRLSNGKAPQHKTDLFTHEKGLLYKHIMDSGQKFLAMVIPKSQNHTVLVEAHDKLGYQGNTCTYCFIKCQYYWKGINKNIRKYIANCTLYCREKAKSRPTHFR